MSALDDARGRVAEAGGQELVERLEHLDRARGARRAPGEAPAAPDVGAAFDLDVLFLGGGLSLLIAPLVARAGLRVGVADRARVGAAHREWNASGRELEALVDVGIVSRAELDELVVARYESGFCRWHGGGTWDVHGALDHAVDAGSLLTLARRRAEEAGVTLLDHHEVVGTSASAHGARARLVHGARGVELTCRVLVEARGASQPGHQADLACPTVGGVLTGIPEGDGPREIDPRRGEILVSTEGVEAGRQHVWEGFPGRPGETTVYLFYYAPRDGLGPSPLLSLYGRFFATLGRYKGGTPTFVRPTFGVIPGWTRLGAPPRPAHARLALVGDAAARHSPLTFCGFGAMLRSLAGARDAIVRAASTRDPGMLPSVVHDTALHRGTGVLARLMATPGAGDPDALNRLLDTAFGALFAMGDADYGALLRDELDPAAFTRFLLRVSAKEPRVYADVVRALGLRGTLSWAGGVASRALRG